MPLSTQKLNPNVKEFEKGLLKFGLVALFFVFGLFGVFSDVLAFTENFDSYVNDSALHGQGGWTTVNQPWYVRDTYSVSTPHSVFANLSTAGARHFVSALDIGEFSGDVWLKYHVSEATKSRVNINLRHGTPDYYVCLITLDPATNTAYPNLWDYRGEAILTDLDLQNKWVHFNLSFDASTDKGKLCIGQNCSEWFVCKYGNNPTPFDSITEITLRAEKVGNFHGEVYFDNLYFGEMSCGAENCGLCETWYTCQNVGCCWYYSTWLHENFCVPCPTGECGSTFYECQNCLTQETCDAEESCYWFNGLCKFGLGVCGEGFDCEFCESQETCEAKNCHWFNDFCWQFEPPEVFSWVDYYSEHGDYPTSSVFVNQMASTTGIIFGSIGSFLTGFVEAFDTSEARAQGENFGSAIPKMRGYLAIFNDFFGELPVAQAFLFLISFLLAVGTFRLIRNLIALFKFW